MKKEKIYNGKYITYKDEQSLADSHDMLVKALPGQSYLKETMNKVSTTQVTGEAIKKVSVGGKGGFGSQGDVREQAKQVEVGTRVMVLSDPSQEAFDHNASLEKIVGGWDDEGKPIYIHQGESITYKRYDPSHLFGDKKIKGWVEFTKSHGRDYDEFAHSADWDASDNMRSIEMMYRDIQAKIEIYGMDLEYDEAALERSRKTYDETCGYRGAWKYVGIDGAEHRRYVITIVNTLNQNTKSTKPAPYKTNGGWQWFQEMSHRAHNNQGGAWHEGLERKDTIQYMMWQFDQMKPYVEQTRIFVEPVVEPSEEFLAELEASKEREKKRRFEAFKNAPKLEDWRIVYKWECTRQGKIMFLKK